MPPSSKRALAVPSRHWRVWIQAMLGLALALVGSTSAAQPTSYDAASGMLVVPSVQVGAEVYTNVRLLNLGGFRFALQTADLQTPPGTAVARYDAASGLLAIPAVKVGTEVYLDVTLLNVGSFTFALQTADLLPAETLGAVNDLLRKTETLWATAAPVSGAARMSLTDGCYRNDGRTRAYLVSEADADPANFRGQYAYLVGEKLGNLQVLARRSVTVPGAGNREELDVQYDATYGDGSVAHAVLATVVSGSTLGVPGCSTGQSASNWRYFGNQQLVQVAARSRNIRDERYLMSTGNVASPGVYYTRDVQWSISDPMGNATYVVVSGPGPAATVGGVASPFSLKMVSPRLLRSAPELAGKTGNFLNWLDADTFRFCRIAGSGVPVAALADCTAQGAKDNAYGFVSSTLNSTADASFDSLGFVAGGLYTFAVYNDDGWKTINGHAGRTPIAVYTDVLESLPMRFVDMAGAGATADKFPRLSFGGMSIAQVRSNLLSASPAAMGASWTALPAGGPFRVYDLWEYFQGAKTGNAGGASTPGYRSFIEYFPGSKALSASGWPVSPKLAAMSSKAYAEFVLLYVDRDDLQILSKVSFN
ncbi:MAG: hypothetical protein IPP44_08605 [Ideonella sp.]|nr:hypothetical protein [Ideonella sp.]